jgi:glycopeptide antibiotics resistance protein
MPCTPTILPLHAAHSGPTRPGALDVIEELRTWWPVVLATVLFAPVGVLICVLTAKRRTRRGMPARQAWRWSVAEVGMVIGTLPWTWMALTRLPGEASVSLVPFVDVWDQVRTPGAWAQIFANVVFLLPFGLFAPLRWQWARRPWRVLLVATAFSATLEALQYLLDLGRVSSVDDVIQNSAGAFLGAWVATRWSRPRRAAHDRPARDGCHARRRRRARTIVDRQ